MDSKLEIYKNGKLSNAVKSVSYKKSLAEEKAISTLMAYSSKNDVVAVDVLNKQVQLSNSVISFPSGVNAENASAK